MNAPKSPHAHTPDFNQRNGDILLAPSLPPIAKQVMSEVCVVHTLDDARNNSSESSELVYCCCTVVTRHGMCMYGGLLYQVHGMRWKKRITASPTHGNQNKLLMTTPRCGASGSWTWDKCRTGVWCITATVTVTIILMAKEGVQQKGVRYRSLAGIEGRVLKLSEYLTDTIRLLYFL